MIDKKTNMRTPDESIKVAKRRVENVLKHLKLIGNLSNSYYSLTDSQIRDIVGALDSGVKDATKKLRNKSNKSSGSNLFNPKW